MKVQGPTTAIRVDRAQPWTSQHDSAVGARQTNNLSHTRSSPIAVELSQKTAASKVNAGPAINAAINATVVLEPRPLSSVAAVIGEICDDSVVVICNTTDGEYKTRFLKSFFPSDLLMFGQPVSLSFDFQGSFRAPRFTKRDIDPNVEDSELNAISDWLSSL